MSNPGGNELQDRYNSLAAQLASQNDALQKLSENQRNIETSYASHEKSEGAAVMTRLSSFEHKVQTMEQEMHRLREQMNNLLHLFQLQEKVMEQDRQMRAFITQQERLLQHFSPPEHSHMVTLNQLQANQQRLTDSLQHLNIRPTVGINRAAAAQVPYNVPRGPGTEEAHGFPEEMPSTAAELEQDALNSEWRTFGDDIACYVNEPELNGCAVVPNEAFDEDHDAKALRKAMRGLGCNKKRVVQIIGNRSRDQRQSINQAFQRNFSRELIKDIKRETSGNLEYCLVSLLSTEAEAAALGIRKSIQGLGTDDMALIALLCTRTNEEIVAIKEDYPKLFKGKTLEGDVKSDTSGWYRTLLVALCDAQRETSPAVNIALAKEDARHLYDAGEARLGTDERAFIDIMTKRSFPQLRATFDMYSKVCDFDIEQSIARETSYNFRKALITIVKAVRDRVSLMAELMHEACKGLGANEDLLTFLITSRCEYDLLDIAEKYRDLFKEDLYARVRRETSGHYRNLLCELFGTADFDPELEAKRLRKAMRGWGTNESVLNKVIGGRSNAQRQAIAQAFKDMYNRDLIKDLRSETSGDYRRLLLALMQEPLEFAASELQRAVKGLGTDDRSLIEILCTRNGYQMRELKEKYQEMFGRTLAEAVRDDTSGDYRRLLLALIEGERNDMEQVDEELARKEASRLYQAGEARLGTDEATFIQIFSTHSFGMLRCVFEHYSKLCDYDIEKSIKRETSLDFKKALLTIVRVVRNPQDFMAQELYNTMKGPGTRDRNLIRIIVMHAEEDLKDIGDAFFERYKLALEKVISSDTSGDYRRLFIRLLDFSRRVCVQNDARRVHAHHQEQMRGGMRGAMHVQLRVHHGHSNHHEQHLAHPPQTAAGQTFTPLQAYPPRMDEGQQPYHQQQQQQPYQHQHQHQQPYQHQHQQQQQQYPHGHPQGPGNAGPHTVANMLERVDRSDSMYSRAQRDGGVGVRLPNQTASPQEHRRSSNSHGKDTYISLTVNEAQPEANTDF